MEDFLAKIVDYKRGLLKTKKAFFAGLKKKLEGEEFTRYRLFKKMISRPGQINLIAEIKKASPSAGLLRRSFDLTGIARIYEQSGAAAFSVLTEDKFFLGKPIFVRKVTDDYNLPVLTKDFIIDEGQIYETFYYGSSAVLLIVAILTDAQLKHLMAVASRLDLDCLVEVHDEAELERALKLKADIIGINNRNLKTLKVSLATCEKLIPQIPKGKTIVAESGIKTHQEIQQLAELGAQAVLIGESFLRAPDIGKKVKDVMYGQS